LNLELFEDAIEYCDMVLDMQSDHNKAIYRKGKALAGLYQFDESLAVFK